MKMVKSLILGSAAGLVAMSGAQAADLPVKAKAVEYVKICSLYGAGFYYIPGTDTCIKLGGYLRVDMGVNTNAVFTSDYSSPGGLGNRFTDAFVWRSREDLNIDTRTATEYGVVRTFFDATFTWTDDNYTASAATATTAPLGTIYSQLGLGIGNTNNGTSGSVAYGTLGVYYAFIQFAGFTMGKSISPFSAPWTAYPGNNYDALVGGGGTVTGVNQFVYTAQFGNGVSGTLGFQDPTQYYQAGVLNFGPVGTGLGTGGVNDYANNVVPDIVGNINVTQAWGLAQLSVAAHDNNPAYYINSGAGNIVTGHPDDKWGFAVQGAISIANLPTGVGDVINAQAVYTNGATRYNIQDLSSAAGAWTTFNGKTQGVAGALGGVGFGTAPDSVFNFAGQQSLISTWGGRGAFTHNWNPYWNTAIYGA
jgi:Porin subfamily